MKGEKNFRVESSTYLPLEKQINGNCGLYFATRFQLKLRANNKMLPEKQQMGN